MPNLWQSLSDVVTFTDKYTVSWLTAFKSTNEKSETLTKYESHNFYVTLSEIIIDVKFSIENRNSFYAQQSVYTAL